MAAPGEPEAPPQGGGGRGEERGALAGWLDPVIPEAGLVTEPSQDGWTDIDGVGGWDSYLCEFSVMEYVPYQHKEVWCWAWGEVLRRIREAEVESKEMERGLKWLCLLPQLLLRSARRGGKPGRGNVARRFSCLSVGRDWGALLTLWKKDRALLREERAREVGMRRAEEESEDRRRAQVMKLLGKGQVSRAVGRISSFGVAPMEEAEVRDMVAAKYPARKLELPATLPKDSPIDNLGELRESLLSLRNGISPGSGGLRPEFLKTLAEVMEPAQMHLLEDFGMRYLRGELPPWFYTVWLTVQTVPLYKTIERNTIRPIGIRNPLVKTLHREVVSSNKSDLLDYLEPVQLGMSEGGASKLVHSIRMLLEENPDFVLVKSDVKNGFNEAARSAMVSAIEAEPSLRHMAWHAGTTLAPSPGLESQGRLWGRTGEGSTQGSPEGGPQFCTTWQKRLLELEATLKAAGGMVRAGWDDLFPVGPAEVLFPAVELFWSLVGPECGLEPQLAKSEIYSSTGTRHPAMPADIPLAGAMVDGVFAPGFLLYGVPVGSDLYVAHMLEKKVREVAEKAEKASSLLAGERQGLWTILRSSIKFQFEYWLGLVYPSQVMAAARGVDQIIWEVLESVAGAHIPREEEGLGWEECLDIPVRGLEGRSFQHWLSSLPIRQGGLGITSQVELAPLAFIGSVEQALPFFGGEKGVCPTLGHLVGEEQETRWAPLLASNCRTARELRWCHQQVQSEVEESMAYLGREEEVVEGVLGVPLEGLGEGSTTGHTRKLLSRAREELRLEVFQHAVAQHPDQRARGISSWKERDKLTTSWLLSTPGPHSYLSSVVFAEALATLLSMPSRVCVDRLGEVVGRTRVDMFGERIILENLSGGHWTDRHTSVQQELAALCQYAGIPTEVEPYGLFAHLIPQQDLHRLQQGRQHQVLRPDLRLEVPPNTAKAAPAVRRQPAAQGAAAPPAPPPPAITGSLIAEIKVIGKGASDLYSRGTRAARAVDKRAARIQAEYQRKAALMDAAMGVAGEGPCQRRLAEFPPVLQLCFGSLAECSQDAHNLVTVLAACRVRTLSLRGVPPSSRQMGLEVGRIRQRISLAVVRANQMVLLARLGMVGEGSAMAGRRRSWQRMEEQRMSMAREADWLAATTGQQLIRRGRFWGR